jgi:hypothetical protein
MLMIKRILSVLFTIAVCIAVKAQVRDSRTTIDTTIRPAVAIESNLSGSEAEAAIESYFDSMHIEKEKGKGFIIKKSMGYMLFKRAKAEGSHDYLDYYFVVESKKQKGKDAALVYITVGKGTGNFYSESDKEAWSGLKEFASYLQTNYFEQYKLYTQLASVNKDMEKRKKKLADLQKEKSELESNISNDSLQVINLHEQLLKLKTKKE